MKTVKTTEAQKVIIASQKAYDLHFKKLNRQMAEDIWKTIKHLDMSSDGDIIKEIESVINDYIKP